MERACILEPDQDFHLYPPLTRWRAELSLLRVRILTGKSVAEYENANIPIRLASVKKFNASMCKNMGGTGSRT